ncbi:MAG: GDSL family lipase [Luteitalea sp.]|nr:GDSL family lipase [Luteitalea sp.]
MRALLGLPLAAGITRDADAAAQSNAAAGGGLRLAPKSKLVMIGDSITDTGRARPVGEGRGDAIGNGYVMMVNALIGATQPQLGIRIVNMGISGNTVRDLAERWQTDVFDLQPDYVSVMIGANDVWRQFDAPLRTELHVPIDEFERTYDQLIATTRPRVKEMILITPFYLEPNREDAMRAKMDAYGDVVRRLAKKHGTPMIDSQAAFDEILEAVYPAAINADRVHPDQVGAMVLARAFVNAIGFQW